MHLPALLLSIGDRIARPDRLDLVTVVDAGPSDDVAVLRLVVRDAAGLDGVLDLPWECMVALHPTVIEVAAAVAGTSQRALGAQLALAPELGRAVGIVALA